MHLAANHFCLHCACPVSAHISVLIGSPEVIASAVASSLVSVAAPVRLVMFLLPDQAKSAGDMALAHYLVMGFMALEALLVFSRSDHRRIIDLLAGTQVVDAKSVQQT